MLASQCDTPNGRPRGGRHRDESGRRPPVAGRDSLACWARSVAAEALNPISTADKEHHGLCSRSESISQEHRIGQAGALAFGVVPGPRKSLLPAKAVSRKKADEVFLGPLFLVAQNVAGALA
jgi:hypothetical protein